MTLDGGKAGGGKESRQMGRNAGLFGVIAVSILFSCIGDRGFRRETLGVRSGHEGLADGLGPARQQWSGGRRRRLAATSEWNPSFQARNRLKVGSFTLRGGSSDEWNGDEDASSDDLALDRRMRKGTNVNVDRDGIEWGGEVEIRDDKEDTSRIERELRRRDKVDVFCRKTGLNVGVAKTLLMQYNWNLERTLDIFTGVGNPQWRPGEMGFDPMKGYKLYGPKDMATDWEQEEVEDKLEEKFDREQREFFGGVGLSEADTKEAQMRKKQPPRAFGIEQAMCCNTTWNCVGTAANGVMFDVEAGSNDIVITGIECAINDDKGDVEYVVYARPGSWLNDGFETAHDPNVWKMVMEPRELKLECNPLIELPDGNIDLPNGTFSPLPFDVNKAENCMGYIRIPRGTRCALYVHGRAPGAVVYRHPVRDMNWDFEETFHRYGLDPVIEPRTGEAVQYRYEPQGASLIETDNDGHLRVFSGTTFWDGEPFSSYCPVEEKEIPLEVPCAAFAGVIRYYLANPKFG